MKSAACIVIPFLVFMSAAPAHASQSVVEKTKEGAEKTKDAVVKGTKVAASKTMDGISKTGEVMTDEWIIARIHGRFVNEELLKDSDISVVSHKHVVTLNGTVIGSAGRAKAASVAKGTEGVHRVVNHLTIRSKATH
jgi:osmotically-inducible protein OsmY